MSKVSRMKSPKLRQNITPENNSNVQNKMGKTGGQYVRKGSEQK